MTLREEKIENSSAELSSYLLGRNSSDNMAKEGSKKMIFFRAVAAVLENFDHQGPCAR
jgi:hypothetical protein